MTYFCHFDPFNDFLSQIFLCWPPLEIFSKFLVKIFFAHFPKILTYDVMLTPKMSLFWPFSPKMTYFDQIDSINDVFVQSYVNKPDWHNVSKFLE